MRGALRVVVAPSNRAPLRCATRPYSEDSNGGGDRRAGFSGIARATIVGNVGADVKILRQDDENAIAYFNLATTQVTKNRDGQFESKTEWFSVSARGKALVDSLEKSCKKGNTVFVEGPINIRTVTDTNTGVERKTFGVLLQNFSNYRVLRWASRDGEASEGKGEGGRRGVFGSEGQVYD